MAATVIKYANLATLQQFKTEVDNRYQKKSDVLTYTLKKASTADTGYLATYQLYSVSADATPVETAIGDKINIPRDYLVQSASLETVAAADKASGGKFENDANFAVGDKYIDFTVNVKAGTTDTSHFYINVKDLVDDYSNGNGLDLNSGVFSVKIDSSNANGLSVGANGVALAAATTSAAGAMSAADKTKLDGIEAEANKYVHPSYTATTGAETANQTPGWGETFNVSQVASDASGHITSQTTRTVTIPNAVVTANVYSGDTITTAGAAGLMSVADKEKLDGLTAITTAEVTALWS